MDEDQGRNLDGTRVVVRQQRRLISLGHGSRVDSRLLTRRERAPPLKVWLWMPALGDDAGSWC